jgi:hypothetical protein
MICNDQACSATICKDQLPETCLVEKWAVCLLFNSITMAKKELFTKDLQETSAFFKALGHPAHVKKLSAYEP